MSASTTVSGYGVAPASQLHDAHAAQPLGAYLRDLWGRRGYVWYVAQSELRAKQVNTVLGNLWHLLNPVITVGIYYMIFGLLLNVSRGVDNFILYLTVGVFLFRITQQGITTGANSVVNNTGLIKSIRFPRVVLPLTAVLTAFLGAISTLLVMYAVALLTGEPPAYRWALLPPTVVLLFVFTVGGAMIAARATTHLRDTTQILPFLFRILFYASGVIFNVSAYAEGDRWIVALFTLNPMYSFLTIARWTMMGGDDVTVGVVVSVLVWTVTLLGAGFWWFRAGEQEYARD